MLFFFVWLLYTTTRREPSHLLYVPCQSRPLQAHVNTWWVALIITQ
jgi:hypothetical protein